MRKLITIIAIFFTTYCYSSPIATCLAPPSVINIVQFAEYAEVTGVVEYYGKMCAYVMDNYEPDSIVYKFFLEAQDPQNWAVYNNLGASLNFVEEAYCTQLSKMTIPELIKEYMALKPDSYIHQGLGKTLQTIERIDLCEHILPRTIGFLISYDKMLLRNPEILKNDPSFQKDALNAKKEVLVFREWAYRHWDGNPKLRSCLIFNLKNGAVKLAFTESHKTVHSISNGT
jgi:hypothetical protein